MDQHLSSPPTTPAPYGHACASCSQSKCKCIVRRGGGACERCRRLNRKCEPSETVRRRSSRKPAVSKTVLLERKIDGLVSLIRAGVQPNLVTPSSDITAMVGDMTSVDTSMTPVADRASSLTAVPSTGPHNVGSMISPGEAEEYLINFQTYRSKYLPLVSIPSTTTAKHLQQERPFLWLCIMAAGSKSTSQKQLLGREIRQTVAQEVVVQSERNIDLLMGLLTFISCAHDQIGTKPFLTVYAQLAISLVFDLGLNKPVAEDTAMVACVKEYVKPPTPRTIEERRAVLGCFLITSIISSLLQRIDALCWTPHMDECLQILSESKDHPNDEILIQQVRIQLIVQNIAQVKSNQSHTVAAPSLELGSLYAQFQDLKTDLLAQPDTNEAVLLHLYSAELETTLAPVSNFLRTKHLTPRQRQSLRSGLESMKSWFDVFFNIPPAAYIGFSFSTFSQLLQCLHTLYWPATLDDPNWDDESSWKQANTLGILDHVLDNLEQVAFLAGIDSSNCAEMDPYSRAARKFRSVRPWWAAKLGYDSLAGDGMEDSTGGVLPEALASDFFDDDWLMELLLPPAY